MVMVPLNPSMRAKSSAERYRKVEERIAVLVRSQVEVVGYSSTIALDSSMPSATLREDVTREGSGCASPT
jgi:hypothetical protein